MKPLDLGDVGGLVAAVAAFLTLIVYVVIAKYAKRQLDQAERIREEQARPYVIAEFIVSRHLIDFRVTNIGKTMAKSITFSWDQVPESSYGNSAWSHPEKSAFLRDGLRTLAPQQDFKTHFDSFVARFAKGLPMTYTITLRYNDSHGTQYVDTYVLDLSIYVGREYVEEKTIHDVAEGLERLAKIIQNSEQGDQTSSC